MSSGILYNENTIFYHPFDDFTEYTKGLVWSDFDSNSHFVSGVLTSGIQRTSTGTPSRLVYPGSTYDSLGSVSGFTIALWIDNFLINDSLTKLISVGITNTAGSPGTQNSIAIYKTPTTDDFQIAATINSVWGPKNWTPTPQLASGWHFFVVDMRYETSGWRHRVSLDGSGWVDLGVNSIAGTPDASDTRPVVRLSDATTIVTSVDEVVLWGNNDLFTNQELSNLYELYNTHNVTMDQYTSIFGTPVSGNVDCFIYGYEQISNDSSLYIPGQKEIKSTNLFTKGLIQNSGNIDLYISGTYPVTSSSIDLYVSVINSSDNNVDYFIQGYDISSGNMTQYVEGHKIISGSIDMYISGIPAISSSINLYMKGPLQINNNIDNSIVGHIPISGNFSLFIQGRSEDINAFVSVSDNNPDNNLNLFTHGVPSGVDNVFYTNDTMTLFIQDQGDKNTVSFIWSSFARVDDSIAVSGSNDWLAFMRGGNTTNNNISMYINSHASGEAVKGTQITNDTTMMIAGLGELLFDGYSVISLETSVFTKVHLGLNDVVDIYISGTIIPVPPSSSFDLFILGILDTKFNSNTLYTLGRNNISDNVNLFVFGIQDTQSNTMPLYMEVTNVGLFDKQNTLYTHGF